ncbi:MAG: agmatinase [Candidatus Hadarchaeota archaeon]|nr:agmatinase [Candidatus Hadarchaeota archaeon]
MISEYLRAIRPGFGGFDEPFELSEIVFVGAPLDVTSSYRKGSCFAPARIREASMNLESYVMPRLDVFERLRISDVGDLELSGIGLELAGERIAAVARKLREEGKVPGFLGGEHTLTYFTLKAFDDVFVIQLDAHRDLRDEFRGERVCHATFMRRVLEDVPPERLIQIGTRSCSKEEEEFARGSRLRAFTAEGVLEDLLGTVERVGELVGGAPVYLTVDLDVLDPAFAPAVATPEPGGLATIDLLKIVRELGKLDIQGFDVVEFTPPYDSGTTAFAAAKIIYEVLAAIAGSRE